MAPFLNPLSSPFPHFHPSLLALLCQDKHLMFHSVSLLSQAPLVRGSRALPSVLLEKRLAIPTSPFFIYTYIHTSIFCSSQPLLMNFFY